MPDPVRPVCLMTGASGGLGSTALPMFFDAGFRIAGVALDRPVPLSAGATLLPITADLTSSDQAERAVRQTLETFGRLDCLVHMVGYFCPAGPIEDTPAAAWDRTLAVNLSSVFQITQAAIPPMKQAGTSIVIVGSTVAIQPVATWSAFSAARGGLDALVKAPAADFGSVRMPARMCRALPHAACSSRTSELSMAGNHARWLIVAGRASRAAKLQVNPGPTGVA